MSKPFEELRIVSVHPVVGDWFALTLDGGEWFIERVRAWTIVERVEDRCQWLTAFGECGSPIVDPIHSYQPGAEVFVTGDDLAPDGRTWRQVFNAPPIKPRGVRCISAVLRATEQQEQMA